MTRYSRPRRPGPPSCAPTAGDFRAWKDHDVYQRTYQRTLERLLRDLRVETTQGGAS
jgi:hypothetical protein